MISLRNSPQRPAYPSSTRFRDLLIYRLDRKRLLVTACDAAGGIGPKPADTEQVPAESVGYFCMRVVLMELLSVGATPCFVSCTLGVERDPTGRMLLSGVSRQLKEEQLEDQVAMVVSSENNFPTEQTSIGVTLSGLLRASAMPGRHIRVNDKVFQIGQTAVGREARMDDRLMASIPSVRRLAAEPAIHEIIPLGSGGVAEELTQLTRRGISVKVSGSMTTAQLSASAGAATAVLAVASRELSASDLTRMAQRSESVHLVGFVSATAKVQSSDAA